MENNTENNSMTEAAQAEELKEPTHEAFVATLEAQAQAEAKKERKEPAYKAFVAALEAQAAALGLSVKEQKGYFQFSNPATGHRMVVAKQGKAVTRIDTTLEVLGEEGTYPLSAPNGRIVCHIEANPEIVARYLQRLATSTDKIRAPKREKKAKATEDEQAQASA